MRFLLALVCVIALASAQNWNLPQLFQLNTYNFTGPYGCVSYNQSSLWLSDFSYQSNTPDLLYAGCAGCSKNCQMQFSVNTVVFDSSSIVQLPSNWDLSMISASSLMGADWYNTNINWHTSGSTPVVAGATYGVVIAKDSIRAMYAFTVNSFTPNGPLSITYGVLFYEIQKTVQSSPGSDYSRTLP